MGHAVVRVGVVVRHGAQVLVLAAQDVLDRVAAVHVERPHPLGVCDQVREALPQVG